MAGWSRLIVFKVTMVLVAASLVSSEAQSELQSLRGELIHRSHFSSPSSWNLAIPRSRTDLIAVKPMPAPKETSNSFMANMSLAPHEYLMSVSLGTPPQDFVAVISTGTDLTWIQCEDCESCVNRSLPTFKPALSSSYSTIKCNSIACSDLSPMFDTVGRAVCLLNFSNCDYNFFYDSVSNTSGTLAHETIHLRTAHSALTEPMTYFSFGCSRNSYSNSGLYDGASGVVGLGHGPASFPSQLGPRYGNVFSHCFVSRNLDESRTSPVLFGRDAQLSGDGVQYTPILQGSRYPWFHYVGLEEIHVDGRPINFPRDALLLDSEGYRGTIFSSELTFSRVRSVALDSLIETLKAEVNLTRLAYINGHNLWFELCYDVTNMSRDEYSAALPTISLKFANTSGYELGVEQSWIEVPNLSGPDTSSICLGFLRSSREDEFVGVSVIGNMMQRNFHISYDRANHRLGFVRTDCSLL